MLVDGYNKCPTCGRPLQSRVLVRLVDNKSREIDFICFSEISWDWLQRTAQKFGLNEERLIRLFAELYIESIRVRKMGIKYHVYYNDLLKMLNLFHG